MGSGVHLAIHVGWRKMRGIMHAWHRHASAHRVAVILVEVHGRAPTWRSAWRMMLWMVIVVAHVLRERRWSSDLTMTLLVMRLILWWQSVGSDLQSSGLPRKSIEAVYRSAQWLAGATEHTDRPSSIFPTSHEDCTVSPTPVVRAQADIRPKYRPCFPEQILQILPTYSVW
jgi:hypothetical protein